MAIGWLTILQSVPWTEVIKNAPKVAEGAKKLWNAVGKKRAADDGSDAGAQPAVSYEPHTLEALEARAAALEAAVSDLQGQMLASSELIKALAEQNAQLVKRIEANQKRTLWLGNPGAGDCCIVRSTLLIGKTDEETARYHPCRARSAR